MSMTTKPYWPNVSGHPEGSYAGSYYLALPYPLKRDVYDLGEYVAFRDGPERHQEVLTSFRSLQGGRAGSIHGLTLELIRAHRPAPAAPQETREDVLERAERAVRGKPGISLRESLRIAFTEANHPLFPKPAPVPVKSEGEVIAAKAITHTENQQSIWFNGEYLSLPINFNADYAIRFFRRHISAIVSAALAARDAKHAEAVADLVAVATAMRDYHEHGKHVNALAQMAGDALAKLTFDADAVRAMGAGKAEA